MKQPKLSVVMPVFNERFTIEEIIERVQNVPIGKEIIIVDDGSTDGTREFLKKLSDRLTTTEPATVERAQRLRTDNVMILFQDNNTGKGAAARRGFQAARGDIVIIQDADLEYDPMDYLQLIAPIDQGDADVVYGSRFFGGPRRVLYFWHYLGNKALTLLSNMFTDLNLSDVWTCYKAFRLEVLRQLDLRENRFGFEPEVTAKIAKLGLRIYEVPISYRGRTYKEGKKITWRDGVAGVWCIIRYNLGPTVLVGRGPGHGLP